MRLSKKETRFRTKFIQENRLNKTEQQFFDRVAQNFGGYKAIYTNTESKVAFLACVAWQRFGKAIDRTAVSVVQAAGTMRKAIEDAAEKTTAGISEFLARYRAAQGLPTPEEGVDQHG